MLRLLAITLLACCLSACANAPAFTARYLTPPAPKPIAQAHFEAGISEVDITPPPGLPKAGFATWAKDGQGFRTRLKARAYFLRNTAGASVLILQTDLLAGSPLLHAALRERLAKSIHLPAHSLAITATHTHAAPGGFWGDDFYNGHAANAAGLEPTWFNFLLEQLSKASEQAYAARRPAKVALGQQEVWGLTRNRSLAPHLNNPGITGRSDDAARKYRAINPKLSLLRIDQQQADGQFQPAGAFMSFSIHGTGIPSASPDYHADIWAYLAIGSGRLLQAHYALDQPPIMGAFEASHADVAPNAVPGLLGFGEARRIGLGIAEQAAALFQRLDSQLQDDLPLRSAITEVNVLSEPSIGAVNLCEPAVGAALAAGAHEHRSPVLWHLPFIRPGQPRTFFTDTCQGGKHWLGTRWLQPLILPQEEFPHRWLIQSLHLGDTAWTLLPFEVTVQAGREIEAAVADSFRTQQTPLAWQVISSVANGYTGYATTADEYALQYYEGGHTLYGPNTARFLAAHAQQQSRTLLAQGSFQQLPPTSNYRLRTGLYWPEAAAPSGAASVSTATYHDPSIGQEDYWQIIWQAEAPIDWHQPLISIETRHGEQATWQPLRRDGALVDDQGFDLGIRQLDAQRYQIRWYNPVFNADDQFRFRITGHNGAATRFSPAFP